jgi:Tfp pilus assembly protein PilF
MEIAERYCSRAVERFPQNAAYLDSLALVFRRKGQLQRAKELYENAVRLSHGRAEIVDHYKELLREAGVEV